jgi:hypothetical protein
MRGFAISFLTLACLVFLTAILLFLCTIRSI